MLRMNDTYNKIRDENLRFNWKTMKAWNYLLIKLVLGGVDDDNDKRNKQQLNQLHIIWLQWIVIYKLWELVLDGVIMMMIMMDVYHKTQGYSIKKLFQEEKGLLRFYAKYHSYLLVNKTVIKNFTIK